MLTRWTRPNVVAEKTTDSSWTVYLTLPGHYFRAVVASFSDEGGAKVFLGRINRVLDILESLHRPE